MHASPPSHTSLFTNWDRYDFAVYGALSEDIGRAFFQSGCEKNGLTAVMDGAGGGITSTSTSSTWTTNALGVVESMGNTTADTCADDNLIESFAVFGGAFLMRPLGAVIFGYIGDTYGRKRALELSVQMMCVATVLMGCLPTYKQAGVAAPILLCLIRLFQGVSVGGELIGSIVYTTETAPPNRSGQCVITFLLPV